MYDLSPDEKSELLKIARKALSDHISGTASEPESPESPALLKKCGAFVTIKNGTRLRGCIGFIVGTKPLYMTVAEMAVSAGTADPRFEPVTPEELPEVDFEISALSPFEAVSDVSEIAVGTHGLLIKQGYRQGLLLPQVAVEHNWNREEFLRSTCVKAGLPEDAWRAPETEIQRFSAVVFGEKE